MRELQNAMVMSRVVVGMLTSGLARPTSAPAAAQTLRVNTTQTLGSVQFDPCAGEYIALSGDYHALFHVTFDPTGGTHVVGAYNSQGISGVGLQSGMRFQAAAGDRITTNIFGAPGFETTDVDTFQLISQGQGPDFLVHVTIHMTFAPDQGFTAQVSNVSSECQ